MQTFAHPPLPASPMRRLLRPAAPRRPAVGAAVRAACLVAALAACNSGDGPVGPARSPIAGSWRATTFRVTPTGQQPIDVLAAGGTFTIDVALDGATTGQLVIPPSVGGSIVVQSMAGTATLTGTTVRFQQSADTFVRDAAWTYGGNTLSIAGQQIGSGSFTVTLTRQ